ncbi:MAG TPA: DUF3291 domain-containing protein [Terracidiphilus sp.]|jgi:hypothetical protein|nr:DUF3291 domain-containing protein [Terracidiphilus sp.]
MSQYQIAQVNIGRIRAELSDPIMSGFVNRLDEINALADASPGFVWRLQTGEGNATYLRPFQDERTLLNMSVWETVESLRHFVFKTMHVELLRQRHAWFEKFSGAYAALWWVPAGHHPGVDEAKQRLDYLERNGASQFAFTFNALFAPDKKFQKTIDWTSFRPCTAQ